VIVYREQRGASEPTGALRLLARTVERLPRRPAHDSVVGILVDFGAIEAGIADALAPTEDDDGVILRELRHAALTAGHLLLASWRGDDDGVARWRAELAGRLRACADRPLPASVEIRVPEGFAQYGHYPECHLRSAERLVRELRPESVLCIGLRSIGTALSAVVAACLDDAGCPVSSYTLRPRGHPFDRRPALGESLRRHLADWSGSHVLLVDEGPGLSGSSLGGTAETLSALGIVDERIVLLPSWDPSPESLRSAVARRRWSRHRRYVSSFEDVWLESGRLDAVLGDGPVRDISAGRWREELIADAERRPPVHPHHERRKFLRPGALIRFVGLGGIGEARLARARALADAGFSPRPSSLAHGFLTRELVPGTPLVRGEVDAELLDRIAHYLACLRSGFALPERTRTDLTEMIRVNLAELGLEWAPRARVEPSGEPPVAVDGRMLPHEWLRTPRGYLKVDALDHHDDHFFPGPVDIAWDLAAAAVELGLAPAVREALVERYRRASGDRTIAARLPYYTVGYLAARLGYVSLAAEALRGSRDGDGFARQRRRYRAALASEPGVVGQRRRSA
jgi:hypothetical protein